MVKECYSECLDIPNGTPPGSFSSKKSSSTNNKHQQDKLGKLPSTSTSPSLPNGLLNAKEDLDCQALEIVEKHLSKCSDARKIGEWKSALREGETAFSAGADYCPQVNFFYCQ
ncbi:hypothetical protein SOVF_025590 isoform B [Spinacia oleracea]|nr:hypothetical protein SOVF_025590 isoform B [Spinacia oleracea]